MSRQPKYQDIINRLLDGEDFRLFDQVYTFMQQPARDGIYHHLIQDKRQVRVGAAIFTATHVLVAFSYGKFKIPLKDFNTIDDESAISKERTWHPGDSQIPLQFQRPPHL